MKFKDQLSYSLMNLRRRKLRSFLTILGVIIGTAAIVVMLSIGIANSEFMRKQIEDSEQLTLVTIYGGYMGGPHGARPGGEDQQKKLDDKAVQEISVMPHVQYVAPSLSCPVFIKSGPYELQGQIRGITPERRADMHLTYSFGSWPEQTDEGVFPLVIGSEINYQFFNPKDQNNWGGMGDPGFDPNDPNAPRPDPPVNMAKQEVFAIFDTDAYWKSQNGGEDGQSVAPPKKYMIKADGIIANPDKERWGPHSYDMLTDLDALKHFMTKVFRGRAWPGQPTNKNGKATGDLIYEMIEVRADDIAHTKEVMQQLRDLGYQANSAIEYIESMKEQARRSQMLLGGIGAISLLVAAIGIANTMMMSIYERTREIGVFKVLGCSLKNIRNLFLLEAGFIGLIGGILGAIISFIISFLLNSFSGAGDPNGAGGVLGGMMGGGPSQQISVIPPWLILAAILFATLVGMISGLLPARRAMRLSPLEALRTQ